MTRLTAGTMTSHMQTQMTRVQKGNTYSTMGKGAPYDNADFRWVLL